LKPSSTIFLRAFLINIDREINYSNEVEVSVERLKYWRKLGDFKFSEGQFTGVATRLDNNHLTFLRLNQDGQWEQYKHYFGSYYDPDFTWIQEKFEFNAVSPREEPLFFSLNLNQDFSRPTAFLGGGYNISPLKPNEKNYLNDFYWVFDVQNFLPPMPFGNGPVAHFTLNRNQYFLEEKNTDKFWSYFSLEEFIPKKAFPKLSGDYDYLGIANRLKGYIIAQKLDGKEVLLFEYNDVTNEWAERSRFPGEGRIGLNQKIYYGFGQSNNPIKGFSDIWEYDPNTDEWEYITKYPGSGNIKVMANSMSLYAIIFGGYQVRSSGANSEKYFNASDTWIFFKDSTLF
jgi:hypothetical protein